MEADTQLDVGKNLFNSDLVKWNKSLSEFLEKENLKANTPDEIKEKYLNAKKPELVFVGNFWYSEQQRIDNKIDNNGK